MRNEVLDGSLVEASKHEERIIDPSSREECQWPPGASSTYRNRKRFHGKERSPDKTKKTLLLRGRSLTNVDPL